MNVRGGILGGKSCGTSGTGSLQLFRRKATHKIWLMGVGVGVPTGGRFNLVVGSISFNCTMDEIFKNLVDHSTSCTSEVPCSSTTVLPRGTRLISDCGERLEGSRGGSSFHPGSRKVKMVCKILDISLST